MLILVRNGECSQSTIGSCLNSESTLPDLPVKSSAKDGLLPRRHIKIESPSVAAAAKKTALEKIEDEAPETGSSVTSDEDTLVCKSKSGKSNAGDATVFPTKPKL